MKRLKILYWFLIVLVLIFLSINYQAGSKLWRAGGMIGFSLGVAGSILMFLSLFYSFAKRVLKSEKWLGNQDLHIFLGALGFILILFHCNFSARGVSSVALVSAILVSITGMFGEFFGEYFKKITHFWDYLHIAFSVVLVFSSVLHIVIALIFHRGFS